MGFKVLTIYLLLNLNDSPLDLGRNSSFISNFTLNKAIEIYTTSELYFMTMFP